MCPDSDSKVSKRQIGTASATCFDGPCRPWTKGGCVSCGVRPMKLYQGNNGSINTRTFSQKVGMGILLTVQYRDINRYPYYCLDNGAFPAWVHKREWDERTFLKMLDKCLEADKAPDFVVVPDQVAKGRESLEFSNRWLERLPRAQTRYMLAVQDGMTTQDVENVIDQYGGLFVGGTMDWKLRTSPEWVELAHLHRKPCHIGRIGPWERIVWAARIGADSIDSTTWVQQPRFYHIENAKAQELLEVI